MKLRSTVLYALLLPLACVTVFAHVDEFPSIHDTVAGIKLRLAEAHSPEELIALNDTQLFAFISEEEREVLGAGHIRFTVNVPVVVSVIRDPELNHEPFWLEARGFERQDLKVLVDNENFDVWQKSFHAGRIGLGLNSLRGREDHYFFTVKPQHPSDKLEIKDIYPGQCRLGTLEKGVHPYADWDETINAVPDALRGQILVRPLGAWRNSYQMLDYYRATRFPAVDTPDQVTLTWSGDPQTTQTIQWRTSTKTSKGRVQYIKKAAFNRFKPDKPKTVKAETVRLETDNIANDPVVHRHTATLTGLEPDTTYLYSVGDGSADGWSELAEFATAPDRVEPFSFIYMGDAQNGLDRWGTLAQNSFRERPDAKFYIMAGDLVNRGNERWDWDDFFYNADGIFNNRQLVPVLGNHEYQGGDPWLYLDIFTLAENGPGTIGKERAYSFEYSNALFVILDSNLDAATQVDWLAAQLAASDATWKFVVYHHPAYSSRRVRDNKKLRNLWTPIFDKYKVDMALQGHDHAYLRTHPMFDKKPVGSPKEGTIYIVSVSGVKMYDQDESDYTAFGMTNVATYQVLDVQVTRDRLVYRAYDIDGQLRDEITIEK